METLCILVIIFFSTVPPGECQAPFEVGLSDPAALPVSLTGGPGFMFLPVISPDSLFADQNWWRGRYGFDLAVTGTLSLFLG
jgi:hypothetical protein